MAETTVMPTPKKKSPLLIRLLKGTLVAVLAIAAVILFVGFVILDGEYEVSREVTIQAAPQDVHKQVGDLREWPNWLPFVKQDPSVKTTIDQPTGVGAHQHWTSDNGNGKLTFTASDPAKGVEFDMLFNEKWPSTGSLTYEKAGDGTRVTWRMKGKNEDFLGKWMALVTAPMMGPMFDQGLADLKSKVEGK